VRGGSTRAPVVASIHRGKSSGKKSRASVRRKTGGGKRDGIFVRGCVPVRALFAGLLRTRAVRDSISRVTAPSSPRSDL